MTTRLLKIAKEIPDIQYIRHPRQLLLHCPNTVHPVHIATIQLRIPGLFSINLVEYGVELVSEVYYHLHPLVVTNWLITNGS